MTEPDQPTTGATGDYTMTSLATSAGDVNIESTFVGASAAQDG
jgi:hypothetical protein